MAAKPIPVTRQMTLRRVGTASIRPMALMSAQKSCAIYPKPAVRLQNYQLCGLYERLKCASWNMTRPARQQGPRHPGNPGMAGPPVDHEHGGLHGLGAEPVQGRAPAKVGGDRSNKVAGAGGRFLE